MRLCLPHLRPSSGCILNIASRAGTVAVPYTASYCASKAALIHLTACVQSEMDAEGEGVHLYALHPGGIKSAMTVKSTVSPFFSLECVGVGWVSADVDRILGRVGAEYPGGGGEGEVCKGAGDLP